MADKAITGRLAAGRALPAVVSKTYPGA